jgi:hypothetical protein
VIQVAIVSFAPSLEVVTVACPTNYARQRSSAQFHKEETERKVLIQEMAMVMHMLFKARNPKTYRKWLDEVKKVGRKDTNGEIARRLGIDRRTVSKYHLMPTLIASE